MSTRSPYKNEVVVEADALKHMVAEFLGHFGDHRYGGSVKATFVGNGRCHIEVYAGDATGFETYTIDAGKVNL